MGIVPTSSSPGSSTAQRQTSLPPLSASKTTSLPTFPGSQIVEVRRSENAHALYQAMSRGSCRETVDGQAKPMRVWLIHYDKQLRELIDKVMPGGEVGDLDTQVLGPDPDQDGGACRSRFLPISVSLDPEITKISTRVVRDALGVTDTPSRTSLAPFSDCQTLMPVGISVDVSSTSPVRTDHRLDRN